MSKGDMQRIAQSVADKLCHSDKDGAGRHQGGDRDAGNQRRERNRRGGRTDRSPPRGRRRNDSQSEPSTRGRSPGRERQCRRSRSKSSGRERPFPPCPHPSNRKGDSKGGKGAKGKDKGVKEGGKGAPEQQQKGSRRVGENAHNVDRQSRHGFIKLGSGARGRYWNISDVRGY